MNQVPVNFVIRGDKSAAVCECCGKKSKYVAAYDDGQPKIFCLDGWSQAPFPFDFIHSDGSVGSRYDCPSCEKKLRSGKSLKLRSYLENKND